MSDGIVSIESSAEEMQILSHLVGLLTMVGPDTTDPGYRILNRPIYTDDVASNAELEELVSQDVDRLRSADRLILSGVAAGRTSMTEQEAHGFLRSVNEARLVLAARAGAFVEGAGWEDGISQDPALAVVGWLGYVQAELIDQLRQL